MNKLLIIIFVGSLIFLVAMSFFVSNKEEMHVSNPAPDSHSKFEGWDTDLKVSLEKSKVSKKNILLLFTGSDWCPPCKMLESKIFSSDKFKEYASKNLELLVIDFPRYKKMSDEQSAYNESLSDKFKIDGFPTMVFLDSNENELTRFGYMGDDTEQFIERYERKIKSEK